MITLLALLSVTLSITPAFADDDEDLFKIADGKEEVQGGSMSADGSLFIDPTAPTSGDASTYVKWINTRIESGKKHWMATLAAGVNYKISTKCLWHKEAFQFKKIGTDPLYGAQYEVACLAGPSDKTITHLLKFKMNVKTMPDGCVGDAAMTSFFNTAANRTAQAATDYAHGIINSTCKISVLHTDYSRGKVIQSAQLLTADSVNKILQSDFHKELRGIVQNSKKAKGGDGDVTNPAKMDDDDKKAD